MAFKQPRVSKHEHPPHHKQSHKVPIMQNRKSSLLNVTQGINPDDLKLKLGDDEREYLFEAQTNTMGIPKLSVLDRRDSFSTLL
jgi:hypothetical protein